MADHSELVSQKQQPRSHELPSLDHQQSIYSLTLDEFHTTFSDGNRSFGSMNMDELLDNIGTAEEFQAYTQTPVTNNTTALATTAAPTTNFNPPEGTNNIQPGLPRQGSLTLPALLRQKTVDEVWFDIHNFQEPDTTVDVQKVGSEASYGEMTLEEFLVKAGVIRGQDHPPKQPCEAHESNNTVQLESGYVARPVMALGGSGNVQAYGSLPQSSSARDAASVAVGQIPVQCQPQNVCYYDKRMQNNIDGGGYVRVQGQGSPVTPISSDDAGANQANSVNQTGTEDVDGKNRWSGPVEKVVARRQRRMIKNRESAARSRARKQAYTLELEAELKMLKEENGHLKKMEQERKIQLELERKRLERERKRLEQERKSQSSKQNIEKKLKARKTTSTKAGLKRNWSWPCVDDIIPQ